MNTTLFRLREAEFGEGVELFIAVRTPSGSIGIVQPMQVVMRDPEKDCETAYTPPVMRLDSMNDFQPLMDELWRLGVRPSDIGTPGHLAATQAHLADMRKLVQKTLDVQL